MSRFIEPTKPIRSGEEILETLNDSYTVDVKFDGFRAVISSDENIKAVSRHNKPLDIPSFLIEKLKMSMPTGCAIDCEWINTTRIKAINKEFGLKIAEIDCLCVFDVIRLNGNTLALPLLERRKCEFYANLPNMKIENGFIFKVPTVLGSKSKKFYQEQFNNPLSEGVVIKNLNGGLNARWYKVKHR